MIEDIQFPWPEVLAYVKYHHERYNGEGYPLGLRKDEIHLGASILALADYFVALNLTEAHRKAFPVQEALEMVRRNQEECSIQKLWKYFYSRSFLTN